MISIIVPIYNVENYISDCLESIINQTYKDLEIICVNDCTLDNSMTIVKEFQEKDSRIKIINNEQNRGLGGARNAGIDAAKGDYILFVDSDDTIEPNMAERLLYEMQNTNSDMVFCNINLIEPNGQKVRKTVIQDKKRDNILKKEYILPKDISDFVFLWPSTWNKLYKSEIIKKNNIRFIENILYEDHTFYYEYLLNSKRVSYVQESLYNYRHIRPGQIMRSITPRVFEIFEVLNQIEKVLNKYLLQEKVKELMATIDVRLLYERLCLLMQDTESVIYKDFIKKAGRLIKSKYKNKNISLYIDSHIDLKALFFHKNRKKILESIISIKNVDKKHKVIRLCGLKIKIKRTRYKKDNRFFVCINDRNSQMEFAKKYLNYVEIETFSFCNRKCWFCPNSKIDRFSENHFMPEDTYLNVLKQLAKINFNGAITYSRYNEPLADKIILKRIRQAREILPNAFLFTHTNGDYLTKEYLDELSESGLNMIKVQCYLNKDEKFDVESVIFPKIENMSKRLGLSYNIVGQYSDFIGVKYNYDKMAVHQEALDFRKVGVNRGGSIDTIRPAHRLEPCFSPFYRIYIDYDGSVMPCCQVRHDVAAHKKMIMGNVNNASIFEIFSNSNFARIREHLFLHGEKMFPCNECNATLCDDIRDRCVTDFVDDLRKEYCS